MYPLFGRLGIKTHQDESDVYFLKDMMLVYLLNGIEVVSTIFYCDKAIYSRNCYQE